MEKLVKTLVPLFLILFLSSVSFGQDNIVQNGDFSNNLDNWFLEDASFVHNCPVDPYAEAYVEDGWAVIHGRSCTVNGYLHQDLSEPVVNPTYFAFDYELKGTCSALAGFLFSEEEQVLQLRGHRDPATCCPSAMNLWFQGEIVWSIADNYNDVVISPGTFEIYFDYELMEAKAYINGDLIVTFPINDDVVVDRVSLGAHHNCYDGRNDVYAYFDNVALYGTLELPVALDIKPRSCPNPLTVKCRGVLPVAILGTEDFDVATVDVASVRLTGVAPRRSAIWDVATPYEPFIGRQSEYDCTVEGPDGFVDLIMKFKTQEVFEAIEDTLGRDVEDGEVLLLTLTGNLLEEFGGTAILGEDVVVIKKKAKKWGKKWWWKKWGKKRWKKCNKK